MREMHRNTEEWDRILVIYDVATDKNRNRVVRILESYGIRVQRSAFECHLNYKRIDSMKNQLKKCLSDKDSIRIYRICESCFDVGKYDSIPVYSSDSVIV